MSLIHHHFHLRKRIHNNFEKYPHPDKWKNFLDRVIILVSMFGPIMTLPQLYNIWVLKLVEGVSLIFWLSYLLVAMVWVLYGFVHKEKPIIIVNLTWVIIEFLIVLGLVLF